jgi:hypothetical protein
MHARSTIGIEDGVGGLAALLNPAAGLNHRSVFVILTRSFPLLIGLPDKSRRRTKRYPCRSRSRRMQAQASSLSCFTLESSWTLNLQFAGQHPHPEILLRYFTGLSAGLDCRIQSSRETPRLASEKWADLCTICDATTRLLGSAGIVWTLPLPLGVKPAALCSLDGCTACDGMLQARRDTPGNLA